MGKAVCLFWMGAKGFWGNGLAVELAETIFEIKVLIRFVLQRHGIWDSKCAHCLAGSW